LTIAADKELLSPIYKEYLNPLSICIVGAKELPLQQESYSKYEPVYV